MTARALSATGQLAYLKDGEICSVALDGKGEGRLLFDRGRPHDLRWSPDGKRLAYTWKQVKPGVPLAENTNNMNDPKINTQIESFMVIADADGSNPKTILSGKSSRSTTISIGKMDWR